MRKFLFASYILYGILNQILAYTFYVLCYVNVTYGYTGRIFKCNIIIIAAAYVL